MGLWDLCGDHLWGGCGADVRVRSCKSSCKSPCKSTPSVCIEVLCVLVQILVQIPRAPS